MLKGVESLNSIESIAMGYASYFVGSVHHPEMIRPLAIHGFFALRQPALPKSALPSGYRL